MGTLILYELGGLQDRRYSQFSWRTRQALAHEGLRRAPMLDLFDEPARSARAPVPVPTAARTP
jgi:hypothetical protein